MARIGVDLDGVCYDFVAAFDRIAGGDGSFVAERYDFYEDMGMDRDAFLATCEEGLSMHSPLFGPQDPVMEGTVEAFKALRDAGHTIHVVTSRESIAPHRWEVIRDLTRRWLDVHGLRHDSLDFTSDKAAVALNRKLDYFIDDDPSNIEALRAVGVRAYLRSQPYNESVSLAYRRVVGWDAFVAMVERQEGALAGLAAGDPNYRLITPKEVSGMEEVRVTSSTGGQKGRKRARFDLIPQKALWKVAELYGAGAEKYDDHNWRKGYSYSLSQAAMLRHYSLWAEGQDYDPETGCHHLAAVIFHALSLITFQEEHPEMDDRFCVQQEDVA